MLFSCNQRYAGSWLITLLAVSMALSTAGFIATATGATTNSSAEEKLQRYLEAVNGQINPKAREAIPQIDGLNRRLVALRGYLRSAATLDAKWVWSPEQINRYKTTAEYRDALGEVEKVKQKFAELNPGYSLSVNTNIRTLSEQIKSWNTTPSIKEAGDALYQESLKEINSYNDSPDEASVARFIRFLQYARLVRVPTLATPGLSPHGQLRAFDFVVKKGDTIVASTTAAKIPAEWEESGWAKKLNEAVKQSSKKMVGPLAAPKEPWHYSYVP